MAIKNHSMNVSDYWSVIGQRRLFVEVQWRWRVEFGTPPTRVTITRIRDKFEIYGTVQGRCGRNRSSTDNENADAVMQVFARSPKKSLRQCSREMVREFQCSINFEHAINDIPLATIQTVCRSVVGSVLWQKVDILNMYEFKEV